MYSIISEDEKCLGYCVYVVQGTTLFLISGLTFICDEHVQIAQTDIGAVSLS